jgi:tetratricopeptide (TPR) repeat protein
MLAYNEIGVQYMKLNELQKSDEAFQSALKIDANAYMPLLNRGIVLFMLKKYNESAETMSTVLKTRQDDPAAHYFLGQSLANLGKFDEAEKELKQAIVLAPSSVPEAHRILAIIYMSRKDKKRAIAEIEAYLKLMPQAADAEQLQKLLAQLKEGQ